MATSDVQLFIGVFVGPGVGQIVLAVEDLSKRVPLHVLEVTNQAVERETGGSAHRPKHVVGGVAHLPRHEVEDPRSVEATLRGEHDRHARRSFE